MSDPVPPGSPSFCGAPLDPWDDPAFETRAAREDVLEHLEQAVESLCKAIAHCDERALFDRLLLLLTNARQAMAVIQGREF